MKHSLLYKETKIETLCWWIINIILVFTFIFKQITFLSNLALVFLILIKYKSFNPNQKKFAISTLVITLILSSYSIILGNNIPNILRFSTIIYFVCISYLINLPCETLLKPLRITSISLGFIILAIEVYMMFFFDTSQIATLRHYLMSNGLGDIYLKYGNVYAVQLVGTAALPFIFMLSYVEPSIFPRFRLLSRMIVIIGVILAGNFGYLVAIVIFFILLYLYKYSRVKFTYNGWLKRVITIFCIIVCIAPIIYDFTTSTLEKKQGSNAIRKDQTEVLINDISDNVGTILFGNGLGHTLKTKTNYRDYTDLTYYELQIVYFFNQLGFIPFIAFLILNIYLSIKYIKQPKYLITYLSYIIYSATNPYILNTNQVVVIISLVSLNTAFKHNYKKYRQLDAIR